MFFFWVPPWRVNSFKNPDRMARTIAPLRLAQVRRAKQGAEVNRKGIHIQAVSGVE
jgi:hypothetical protein